MKGAALAVGLLLAVQAQAEDRPVPSGYAFDKPQILAQQLVWGVVHGVRLLALACLRRGDTIATGIYADWLDKQWPRVRAAERDLSRYYFDRDQVPMEMIDAALNLRPTLAQPDEELEAACMTLPEALASPRYDLERFYQEKLKP